MPSTLDAGATARATWSLGDYHRFSTSTVWELGPVLVGACDIGPGRRVLDVATGSGNVAIRAAEAGADVVACDLTPAAFAAGRREADLHGVACTWVEADAAALPFADGEFDVVTSCLGAMFAPDQRAAAAELLRVCRPGGTIGWIAFTPESLAADLFAILARFGPSPPPGPSPLGWGDERHVRALLGDRVDRLEMTRRRYVERADGGPEAYRDLFTATFGPVIAVRERLAGDPQRAAALHRALTGYATRGDRGAPGGPAEYAYEYLLVVARTPR